MSTYFCRNRKECLSVFCNSLEGMKREYPNMPWETFRKHAHWCIEENGLGTPLAMEAKFSSRCIDEIAKEIFLKNS